jgi:steroid delta-isomerase-like uncharacterized protein
MEETPEHSSVQTVRLFNEAFNRHDVDAVMNLMADDVLFENTNPPPDGGKFKGAAAVRAYWQQFFAANPTARFEEEEMFGSRDRVIVRWIYRKEKDGKLWHLRGVDVFKVKEGKITEKLSYVKG